MSKISELSDGGSLISSDYLIAVRSGGNVKVRMDQINVDQVDLGDNEFIRLGNSQDLTMVHTSTQSIINQAGIGDLLIQKAGATKLTINATGIDVTGSVTADGLTVDGTFNFTSAVNGIINNPASCFINIDSDNNNAGEAFYVSRDASNTAGARVAKFDATGDISFYEDTGTTPKFFWDASAESLGIGTTSPSSIFETSQAGNTELRVSSTDGNNIRLGMNASGASYNWIETQGTNMLFATGNSEAMRISGGNLLVGTTTFLSKLTVSGQGAFGSADASGNGIYLYVSGALTDNSYMSRNSAGSGTTTWYIGNQSITTSSDLRLKDNIVDSQRNAVEIINNLRVVDHTWNDPSDQSINNKNSRGVWTGLIAQEAVEHIPWLVNRPLEDVDENGNKNYWHMDYGYSVPLLIKAIQEQQATIEALTARIAALES